MSAAPHARGLYPDLRGPAWQRRRRRQWLVDEFGDGETVPCWWCQTPLTTATLEVDRHPVCGHDGGTYRRTNIVPACFSCNHSRCSACVSTGSHRQRRCRARYDGPDEDPED